MTERHAILLAIKANPNEDTVRMAYADFLDENGEAERAELVRVQLKLAQLESVPHNGHRSLHSNECEGCAAEIDSYDPRIRTTDLIVLYSRKWLPDEVLGTAIPGCLEGVTQGGVCLWSRGVAQEAVFSWKAWRKYGDEIWERELPWRVRLTTWPMASAGVLTWNDSSMNRPVWIADEHTTLGRLPGLKRTWLRLSPAQLERRGDFAKSMLEFRWPGIDFELPSQSRDADPSAWTAAATS